MSRRAFFAELIGTFILLFCGCGSMVIDHYTNGAVSHLGIALTWGLVVMAMIYAIGPVSGAHMNPAVTLAFAGVGRFTWKQVPGYLIAQATGAFGAVLLLRLVFSDNFGHLGATVPFRSASQAAVVEFALTFILMLVIMAVSQGSKEQGLMAGVAIGGVILLEAVFAGPVSGASMNPIRSLAPALLSGDTLATSSLWAYLLAPVLGALVGAWIHKVLLSQHVA